MTRTELAPGRAGQVCKRCSGVWVARTSYDTWRARQPDDAPDPGGTSELDATDVRKPKICPQSGHLLLPYRVGNGLTFSIDYCGACGGVWCDHREWDSIKARNLHDNLHDIVSAHWQADVRRADVQAALEVTHKRLLGAAYDRAAEVREWLLRQPQRSLILAYLAGGAGDEVTGTRT